MSGRAGRRQQLGGAAPAGEHEKGASCRGSFLLLYTFTTKKYRRPTTAAAAAVTAERRAALLELNGLNCSVMRVTLLGARQRCLPQRELAFGRVPVSHRASRLRGTQFLYCIARPSGFGCCSHSFIHMKPCRCRFCLPSRLLHQRPFACKAFTRLLFRPTRTFPPCVSDRRGERFRAFLSFSCFTTTFFFATTSNNS